MTLDEIDDRVAALERSVAAVERRADLLRLDHVSRPRPLSTAGGRAEGPSVTPG